MKKYEYIRIAIDVGDLEELNRFSRDGWRMVTIIDEVESVLDPSLDPKQPWMATVSERTVHYAVLERDITEVSYHSS